MKRQHTIAMLAVALLAAFLMFSGAGSGAAMQKATGMSWEVLLPLVVTSGFIDGIHPCGFAVLLFFMAFLFSLKRTRQAILGMGALYILGVFAAYFLIGLGILKAFALFPEPHFMAKAGAILVIALGLINIKDYFFYGKWFTLRIPSFSKGSIRDWVQRATGPAALVAGFLVGLCAFPCAGGIYVAILGVLAVNSAAWEGLGYLALYNLMFVAPLIIMLALASDKRVVERLEKWEASEKKKMRLYSGIVMIALGLFILYGGILH